MNLRKKIVLSVVASTVGLMVLAFIIFHGVILQRFAELEEHLAYRDVERVQGAFLSDVSKLGRLADNWASWDDTYHYMGSGDPRYIESNMTGEVFANLGIDLMIYIDSSGRAAFQKSFDRPGGEVSASEEDHPRGLNALLAEDNIVNQKVACRLLEKRGHGVTIAADGLEALEEMKKGDFDLVLKDVQMPGMDDYHSKPLDSVSLFEVVEKYGRIG